MPKINVPGVSFKVITTGGSAQVVYDGTTIPPDSVLFYDSGLDNTIYAEGSVTTGGTTSFTDSAKAGLWVTNEWSGYDIRGYKTVTISETGDIIGNNDSGVLTATLTGAEIWEVGDTYTIEHPTLLKDTTKTWTTNEWAGLQLINVTDGSVGNIISNTATTITVDALTGGDDNKFNIGDDYEIVINIDASDVIEFDTLTNLGGTVSMSTQGVPSISGSSGTHTFTFRIYDVSDGNSVSADAVFTVVV